MMRKNATHNEGCSPLERALALALRALLKDVPLGAEFAVPSSAEICSVMELFFPDVLRRRHPEWLRESLDGFFIAHAKRVGPRAVEIIGTCILISDQTVTPFRARLSLGTEGDSVASYRIQLGEPSGGPLGISGPPCNSREATRLLNGLMSRVNSVSWKYDASSLESPIGRGDPGG